MDQATCPSAKRSPHRSKVPSALSVWARGVPLAGRQLRIRRSYRNFPGRLLTACLSLWVQLSPSLSSFFWFCVGGCICVFHRHTQEQESALSQFIFQTKTKILRLILVCLGFVISASSLDIPNCEGRRGTPLLNIRNALPWKSSFFIVLPHFVQVSISVNHFFLSVKLIF